MDFLCIEEIKSLEFDNKMDYYQDLENAYKIYMEKETNFYNYIATEILKFYEKNDYYMFKNFVEYNYSKFSYSFHLRHEMKSFRLLERLRIEINGYLLTPYTSFSSRMKDVIRFIKICKN